MQIPGFQSTVADQRQKTLHTIDQLLQSAPVMIPGPPAPPGQPPAPRTPQPSIHPDMFDDHALVDKIVAGWLIGPVGQKHVGTPGFANVACYWNSVHQLAMPPAPPPPPPPMKGSMAVSLKAEDVPSMIPGLLKAAGVPDADLPQKPAVPVPPPVPAGPMGAPSPLGGSPSGPIPGKAPLASPIPPLPSNANGSPPAGPLQ